MIAPSMAEVVRSAGGWLFDQVMAGWDVTVLTADQTNSRPLRILGVRAADLESSLASPAPGPSPQAIAVRADLYGSDERVRQLVLNAVWDGQAEVRLWGDGCTPDFDGKADPVSHRLSVAARAFKAQALAAAAAPADPGQVTEIFRTGRARRPSAVSAG